MAKIKNAHIILLRATFISSAAALEYSKTSTYHWPVIGSERHSFIFDEKTNPVDDGLSEVNGPFGFEEATNLAVNKVS